MDSKTTLFPFINRIHSTPMGIERIKKNMNLKTNDVISYVKDLLKKDECQVIRRGKNYYAIIDGYQITIHASSYTIITVHPLGGTHEKDFHFNH